MSSKLTVIEAAKRLKVSPKIVRAHIAARRIVAVNVSAGDGRPTWRISPRDLLAFESSRLSRGARVERPRRRREQLPLDVYEYV